MHVVRTTAHIYSRSVCLVLNVPVGNRPAFVRDLRAAIIGVVLILQFVVLQGLATGPAATGVSVRRAVDTATARPTVPTTFVVLILMILQVVVLPGLATNPAGVGV